MDIQVTGNEILINSLYAYTIRSNDDNTIPAVKSMVKTDHLIYNLINNNSDYEILPSNCRFYKKLSENKKIIIVEEEPKIRTIKYNASLLEVLEKHKLNGKFEEYNLQKVYEQNKNYYRFSLSFPYIIYFIFLDENNYCHVKLFFRLHPLTSLNDYLLIPSLPNISVEFNVCLGETKPPSTTILDTVNNIIDTFWNNSFNEDYSQFQKLYENVPEICDFFTWSHNTKVDPLFIFDTKWKPADKNTLLNLVESFESNIDSSDNFYNLLNLVSTERNTSERKIEHRELRQSYFLKGLDVAISIGDEVEYKNETYNIYSFVFIAGKIDVSYIKIENTKTGKIISIEEHQLNNSKTFKKKEQESIDINGVEFKVNDLLLFKNSGSIKMLKRIIKRRDGNSQIEIGRDFYLTRSFKDDLITKIDLTNKIKIGDISPEFEKKYYLIESIDELYTRFYSVEYKGIGSDKKGNIVLNFEGPNKNIVSIDFDGNINQKYQLIDFYKIDYPPLIRFNNYIIANKLNLLLINKKICVIDQDPANTIGLKNRRYINIFDKKLIENYLLSIKDQISIPSIDFDLNFKIGDHVIYTTWLTPEKITEIKTITSFILKDEIFYFELKNDKGEITNFPFINLKNGYIDSSSVRKVCEELNNIKIGTKVIANKSGIQDFPKKDCNEIKAFIIDEEEPLLLFSNFRTIYFRDFIENFELFDKDHKKYDKLKIVDKETAIGTIKKQEGDLLLSDLNHFYNFDHYEKICIKINRNSSNKCCVDDFFSYDYLKRSYNILNNNYGILYPRYSANEYINNSSDLRVFVGMRGNITKCNNPYLGVVIRKIIRNN